MAINSVYTEGRHTGEYIKHEVGTISRDNVTIAAGSGVLEPCTVLGQISASKKYTIMKTTATDGSQVAAAILYREVDATAADAPAAVTARLAEVFALRLVYDASVDTPAELAAVAAQLAAQSIILR